MVLVLVLILILVVDDEDEDGDVEAVRVTWGASGPAIWSKATEKVLLSWRVAGGDDGFRRRRG
jgi:hypothetical protein